MFLPAVAGAQTGHNGIRLNQIGFYPEAPKVAIIVGSDAALFHVTTPDLEDTVYTGTLDAAQNWVPSGESARKADFSDLQDAGNFVVTVPGLGVSHRFTIAEFVHQQIARAALRGFYYQRASTALEEEHAKRWARRAGHPDTNVRIHPSAAGPVRTADSTISSPRGWYDAGDYSKYIVNSGITMGTLFMLYEHFPGYFAALDLNIPESGNGLPDLLNEALWNLRWMLTMQDPHDGGVYHKLTTPNFDAMIMPHQATQPRYVVQKGTAATLDFAAVTAMAARIFREYEHIVPGLADSCLAAARYAWAWAMENPDIPYNQSAMNQQFNPNINTGEYGDTNFGDEFRWAAAELFITTGDDGTIQAHHPFDQSIWIPSWQNVAALAFISLAHHRTDVAASIDTSVVKNRLITLGNWLLTDRANSAFDVVMGGAQGGFWWGSNSHAANQGIILLQAYRLTGDDRYLEAALSNLDYLLGRNGTGFSFVTGHGGRTPRNPHHRPSAADGIPDPVPGLLVGGPNPGRQDQSGCPAYPSQLPAKAYLDHVCSYASNEIAINWNAPLAYLSGAIEAIYSVTGLPTTDSRHEAVPEPPRSLVLATYPNPAHVRASAQFETSTAGPVTLVLYDVMGRAVRHVVDSATLPAGRHTVDIDTGDLASGVYVLQLQSGNASAVRLMQVVR